MPSFADRGDRDRALEQEMAVWVRPGLGETSTRRIRKLARDKLRVYDIGEDLLRPPRTGHRSPGGNPGPTLVVILEDDAPEIRRCDEIIASGIPGARKALVPVDHHPHRDPQAPTACSGS